MDIWPIFYELPLLALWYTKTLLIASFDVLVLQEVEALLYLSSQSGLIRWVLLSLGFVLQIIKAQVYTSSTIFLKGSWVKEEGWSELKGKLPVYMSMISKIRGSCDRQQGNLSENLFLPQYVRYIHQSAVQYDKFRKSGKTTPNSSAERASLASVAATLVKIAKEIPFHIHLRGNKSGWRIWAFLCPFSYA